MKTSKANPRLLFLARAFPPLTAIASLRTENIARYLSRNGWDVTVITVDPNCLQNMSRDRIAAAEMFYKRENLKVIFTQHDLGCLVGLIRPAWWERIPYMVSVVRRTAAKLGVDSGVGWMKYVYRASKNWSPGDFDLILASGSPFLAFKAASVLSRKIRCPFVLDYRDLWTFNPYRKISIRKSILRLERQLLSETAAVFTVSKSMLDALSAAYDVSGKIHVISNGYNPEDFDGIEPMEFSHPAIVYAGNLYPPVGSIAPLFKALKSVNQQVGKDGEFIFHYFGGCGDYVEKTAETIGVQSFIQVHGTVSRKTVLSALRGATVNAVITSVKKKSTIAEKGIVTGKIFECMASGRPVLLISPEGSDAVEILGKSRCGESFHGEDIAGIADYILNVKDRKGEITPPASDTYSWVGIGKRLDSILRRLI